MSGGAWACYITGAIGIIAFILTERVLGDDALIPLKLFKSPTFSVATVLGIMVGFGMFGALSTIPLYLQLVKGSTPTESGFQLLPMILGLMIASIVSGQLISRTGKYKIFPILGTGLMSLGFLLLTTIKADTNYWILAGAMLLTGLGLGQLMQTLTIASQNSSDARDIGVATSASTFFRQIGGTLGVAVIFSVVFSLIGDKITASFSKPSVLRSALDAALNPAIGGGLHHKGGARNDAAIMAKVYDKIVDPIKKSLPSQVDLSNTATRHAIVDKIVKTAGHKVNSSGGASTSLDNNTQFLNHASHALTAPFLTGFSESMVTGFWVSLGVLGAAFILSFFLKATPLRTKSAAQEVADQDEAILATKAANTLSAGLAPDTTTGRVDVVVPDPEPEPVGRK
jgi:hypothetical protein